MPVPWLSSADQTASPSFSAHPRVDPVVSERERYSHRLYKYTHLQCISSATIHTRIADIPLAIEVARDKLIAAPCLNVLYRLFNVNRAKKTSVVTLQVTLSSQWLHVHKTKTPEN